MNGKDKNEISNRPYFRSSDISAFQLFRDSNPKQKCNKHLSCKNFIWPSKNKREKNQRHLIICLIRISFLFCFFFTFGQNRYVVGALYVVWPIQLFFSFFLSVL